MPTATLTLAVSGEDSVVFVLPEYSVAALQAWVDENPTLYADISEYVAAHIRDRMIQPLCERYQSYPSGTLTAISDLVDAEVTVEAAKLTAMADVMAVFSV